MDIPEELQFRDVRKQAPVIISKESRQVLPQNGTRFEQGDSGATQIVFRLPNEENSSTDLSTMWITAELTVNLPNATPFNGNCNWLDDYYFNAVGPAAAGAYKFPWLNICDSIESMIRQVHILVNGSELERHDYYNYTESILNMHTNNANFSNSIGAGCMLMNLNPYEKCRLLLGNGTSGRTTSNKIQVSFPLRWCGIANLRSLVPTYLLGGGQSAIEIRLFLENSSNLLNAGAVNFDSNVTNSYYGSPTVFEILNTPLTYILTDVRMNYDVVQTSDAYTSSLRSYLASNQLTLPIDTYYTTQFDLNRSSGWQNFTISTQMSDISAVFIGFVRSNEQNNLGFLSTDRFYKPPGLSEARLQINGKPYPNVNIRLSGNPVLPEAEAYHYLMKALRQNCSLETIGNANSFKETHRAIVFSSVPNAQFANREKQLTSTSGKNFGISRVAPPNNVVGANGEALLQPRTYTNMSNPSVAPTGGPPATTPFKNAPGGWLEDDAHFWESPSNFILGFDISKSNYNNEYELSGQDLTKSSGLIQVNLKFDYFYNSQTIAGVTDNYTAIVVVKHKRILDIGLDSSQVIY